MSDLKFHVLMATNLCIHGRMSDALAVVRDQLRPALTALGDANLLCDLDYAERQLDRFGDHRRAADALERIEAQVS